MDPALYKAQVLQRYKAVPGAAPLVFLEHSQPPGNQEFINLLIRAFEEDPGFSYREFRYFPLSVIIDYIRRTHCLYLEKSLREIEQSIGLLNQAYPNGHPLLLKLNDFYLDYKTELVSHIREEDDKLLPYIEFLISGMNSGFDKYEFYIRSSAFSISRFLDEHHDNDNVLLEVRDTILQYDPPVTNKFIYQVLLNQLDFFSHDLKIHGLIEDRVLLPCAREMEQKLTREFLQLAKMN